MNQSLPKIDAAKAALLVMDFQNGIIAMIPDTEAPLQKAEQAIVTMRRHAGTVGYVRVAFEDADFDAVPERNAMFSRLAGMRDAFHANAAGTQIHESIAPQPGDIVVRKTRVGAFTTTDLERQLRERGIETLILAGLSTSGVVLSTVREAMDRDYRIIVLADASGDPEADVHEFLLNRIFSRVAAVIKTDELDAMLAQ